MSIIDTVLERTKGTRWYSIFIGIMIAVSIWTFTGPAVNWVVGAYAAEKLDIMLMERGITKESFAAVQQKLKEIDAQTDGVKQDLSQLKMAVETIAREQTIAKTENKKDQEQSIKERKELKDSLDTLYKFLIERRP